MAIDAAPLDTVVVEDTRVDESKKGADWEFWIGSKEFGWTRLRSPTKRLTVSNSRYNALSHQVRGVPQIDILENYAKVNGAAPIYCFYNFINSPVSWNCSLPFDKEQLGCTITPSIVVREALRIRGGKTFNFIHNQKETIPWRCLVKCPKFLNGEFYKSFLGSLDINFRYKQLPNYIEAIKKSRNVNVPYISSETINRESEFLPRWIAVINVDNGKDNRFTCKIHLNWICYGFDI